MRVIISSWGRPVGHFGTLFVTAMSAMIALSTFSFAETSKDTAVIDHHHKHKAGGDQDGKKAEKKGTTHKHHHKKHHKHAAMAAGGGAVVAQPLPSESAPAKTQDDTTGDVGNNHSDSRPSFHQAASNMPSQGVDSDNNGVILPDQAQDSSKGTETGLPLPRFASFRADRVYMRLGPGERYPIDWVYYRRGLPVQIEREFGVWRLIEDSEGQKGWVHQVTLRGTRDFVVLGDNSSETLSESKAALGDDSSKEDATQSKPITHADSQILGYISSQKLQGNLKHDALLMSSASSNHTVVAVLKSGTVGMIKACPEGSTLCHVTVRGYDGWLDRHALWGVQPGEIIQPD